MIYFDNAATTYPKPEEVYRALDKANRSLAFNAGRGSYEEAQVASKIINETREEINIDLYIKQILFNIINIYTKWYC